MRGSMRARMLERMPSIGRGQILSAEDAPARIDAGIELELGGGGGDRERPLRAWPEEVDPLHATAGVSTGRDGEAHCCASSPGCRCSRRESGSWRDEVERSREPQTLRLWTGGQEGEACAACCACPDHPSLFCLAAG